MTHPDQTDPVHGKPPSGSVPPRVAGATDSGIALSPADEIARLRFQLLEIDDLRGENRRLLAATGQMRAENLVLNRELDGTVVPQELRQMQLVVDDLNKRLELVHASLSWRITAPLRAIAGVLGVGRRRA
ncbi:MAG: hypothetical protein WAS23_08045 [Dokdonella sp.]|uniref:hypothetical protein n=1 Tax=Dokdonella sp. TaxID=2291710 RepID=UPI003BAEF6DF